MCKHDPNATVDGLSTDAKARFPENNWEDIFQAISNPTLILDPQYNILHANQAAVNATGKSEPELLGKKCYQVFHTASLQSSVLGCPMAKAVASGNAESSRIEMEAVGGTYMVSCTPVFDAEKKLKQVIHIANPVTDQHRFSKELELQNGYLAKLNDFAIRLNKLSNLQNVEDLITKELLELSGATALTLASYDAKQKCLFVHKIEAESWIVNRINDLFGKRAETIASPISDEVYSEIVKELVGRKKTLHEASYGEISPLVSMAISKLLQADRYIGVAYLSDDQLFGTSLLAMRKDTPDPPFEILRTFAHMAALAMRRREATDELQESEQKYRQLMDTMNEGVILVDNEDTIQFINPAACRIYGYKESDMIGQTGYKKLVCEDDWHIIVKKNASRLNGVTDSYQVRGKKLTGEIIWVRISGAPVRDKHGKVQGSVGILTDVTDIIEKENALQLQNAYLDELIEGAAEAIVVLDNDDIVQRINKEFTHIFEYTSEEAVGRKINDLLVPPEFKKEGLKATRDVTRGKSISLESIRVSKSGKRINVSILGNPIKLEEKQLGVYAIYRDITNSVKIEAQLQQSQRMDSIGRLAGGVAHDFNNMLTVILGYSDELLVALGTNHTLKNDVEEIIKAGNRAKNLTNQLLAFSRKQIISPKVINLNSVITDMQGLLQRLISENIYFKTELDPELASIKADISQMEQVIMNLVVNACDAMPNGGKLSIETSNYIVYAGDTLSFEQAKPGEYILLNLSDTGKGMDKETLSRVFEPFFTTKEFSTGGGLGLATVYGIIKQSDGYISVYSELGLGTTIKILLPAEAKNANDSTKEQSAQSPRGKGQQILVVEDEEILRTLITKIISKLGYSVTAVENGDEALKTVREKGLNPDLVITDVVMPGMNGKELADILRQDKPDCKILFMSGYTESVITQQGILEDGIQFIQKPFARTEMADKIEGMLNTDQQ
jgi:PAS domain S-box-containing protein